MKKIFLFVFILFISFSWISYAVNKFNYESALQIANEYIANSSFDENWKDHNPRIIEKWKDYFTDSDSSISYLEFKVSCDNNPDCWFIMVNFDWDDVIIPIASTSWNTPSEVLIAQNWWTSDDNKLYYFSPFEQYWENENSWEVSSIDPVDNKDQELAQDTKLTKDEKKEKRKEFKTELKNKIIKAKKDAWDYKKTDDFKGKLKEIYEKKLTIIDDEKFKNKSLLASDLWNWWTWYIPPAYASNRFVVWNYYSGCSWKTPCYAQFPTTYNNTNCNVWCMWTAYAILFWYYDRKWIFPNLVSWTAPNVNDTTIINLISDLWHNYMWTICNNWAWRTSVNNWRIGWVNYAKNKWYTNTVWTSFNSNIFTNIKSEIELNRPVILWNWDHAMVWFWYYNSTINPNYQIVRVNLWWWWNYNMTDVNWNIYFWSNIDYNLGSLYYNWTNQPWINTLTKIVISN